MYNISLSGTHKFQSTTQLLFSRYILDVQVFRLPTLNMRQVSGRREDQHQEVLILAAALIVAEQLCYAFWEHVFS
jgi:hypothetical protein